MLISNAKEVCSKQYACGGTIGRYLMKNGIPLFSRVGNVLYFSKTKRLEKALNSMPIHLRLMSKVGVING